MWLITNVVTNNLITVNSMPSYYYCLLVVSRNRHVCTFKWISSSRDFPTREWEWEPVISGSRDWARLRCSCVRWTFGVRLGSVVNLTLTEWSCYRASPIQTNAIQLIYMYLIMQDSCGYFCIFKAFLVFRMTWLFIYQLGKNYLRAVSGAS